MTTIRRMLAAATCCGVAAMLTAGCATSSRKSVSTYDYNDEGRPAAKTEAEPRPQAKEGEYQMVSPGEMVVEPKKN